MRVGTAKQGRIVLHLHKCDLSTQAFSCGRIEMFSG